MKRIHFTQDDFKNVFRTGDRYDNKVRGWKRRVNFCHKCGRYYSSIKRIAEDQRYRLYFTYLDYDYRIHNMIYSTNWMACAFIKPKSKVTLIIPKVLQSVPEHEVFKLSVSSIGKNLSL